jgi:hypothetical protein
LFSLAAPPLVGVVALCFYSIAVSSFTALATGLLIAAASLVGGGVLGFLFALPRSSGVTIAAGGQVEGRLRSSTSLEEIADWLTKILVGLGLVELSKLVDEGGRLIDFLGPALGPAEGSRRAVALALLSLFTLSGFLLSYLGTRISLAGEFAHAEEQLRTREADVRAATSQLETFVAADLVPPPAEPEPSPDGPETAEQVEE